MKQVFKGQILTKAKVVNNILRIWNQTTEEHRYDWYKEANTYAKYLSKRTGYSTEICAGVIAALSPLKTWEQNKVEAKTFLETGWAGHTRQFLNKARAIVKGRDIPTILHGKKITAFYYNIINPKCHQNVTIDRHALSIALRFKTSEEEHHLTTRQYQFFQDAYKHAAKRAGVSPLTIQSATWVSYRKS
jgi:hypothetical protein